jgi:hypothetical protein
MANARADGLSRAPKERSACIDVARDENDDNRRNKIAAANSTLVDPALQSSEETRSD